MKDRHQAPERRTDDTTRRPYERPAIVEEAEFETLALACTQSGDPYSPDFCGPTGGFS